MVTVALGDASPAKLPRLFMAMAVIVLCCSVERAKGKPTECEDLRFYQTLEGQAVTWTLVAPGIQLNSWDAVLTCASSRVVVASNVRFGHFVTWEDGGAQQIGTIGPKIFTVLHPMSSPGPITSEVREVVGTAFYSRDREIFQKHGASDGRSGSDSDAWVIERRRERAEIYRELRSIQWVPLVEGDLLGPWDMLWAQPAGRVEIEITGRNGLINGNADVTDGTGRPTGRKRFPSGAYWILEPELYDGAQAVRVLGDVWRSTNPEQVERFYQRYWISAGSSRDPAVDQAEHEAEERRRREDPEAFERWWAEQVKQNHAEHQRWRDALSGGELE